MDRTRRELTDEDVARIADTYHAWRGEKDAGTYEDISGFCKSATLDEVAHQGFVLTPGRYVGAEEVEEDSVPFTERFAALEKTLKEQFAQGEALNAKIIGSLRLIIR